MESHHHPRDLNKIFKLQEKHRKNHKNKQIMLLTTLLPKVYQLLGRYQKSSNTSWLLKTVYVQIKPEKGRFNTKINKQKKLKDIQRQSRLCRTHIRWMCAPYWCSAHSFSPEVRPELCSKFVSAWKYAAGTGWNRTD